MKYQYITDVSKALQKVYWRHNGTVYVTGAEVPDEMVADIAMDVDAVTRMLIQYEWDFRSDNSDRSASGAKMPPELERLEIQLDTCLRICNTIATKQTDDAERGSWLKRATYFVWWIHMLVDYYPDARTTVVERERYTNWKNPHRKTSTSTKGKSNQHSRSDRGFDYYVGCNFDTDFVRKSIKERLDDHKNGVKGGIEAARVFLDAIEEGEIIATTMKKAFYKEFNLSGTYKSFTDGILRLKKASGSGG